MPQFARRRFVQRIAATTIVAPAVFDDFVALDEAGPWLCQGMLWRFR
jgi:hypothetical protein